METCYRFQDLDQAAEHQKFGEVIVWKPLLHVLRQPQRDAMKKHCQQQFLVLTSDYKIQIVNLLT